MKYLNLDDFIIKDYTDKIKEENIIVFKDDNLTLKKLSRYINTLNIILKNLKEDNITWCSGIILDGESLIRDSFSCYNIVAQINNWNIIYFTKHIKEDDIYTSIKARAELWLQV